MLGLPFFSLAMIAADAVFLPTAFLCWAGFRLTDPVRRAAARVLPSAGRSGGVPEPRRADSSLAGQPR